MVKSAPSAKLVDEGQTPFAARFDWGEAGVRGLAGGSAVAVVVDVLCFSTAVAVALERGATVRPVGRQESAEVVARAWNAWLAVPRGAAGREQPFSLSPVSLVGLGPGDRLVLPSPNGSLLCALAAERYEHVLAGCLRNATAVARAARALAGERPIAVIAAGERRQDDWDAIRPAVEDLIGAGAILSVLGGAAVAPEALAAIGAFERARHALPAMLAESVSGRELRDGGYPEDVAVAAALDVETVAPLLEAGVFRPWQPSA